ncbi:MAG TPA: ABC transporter ATP-binding protein [Gaiellaceae bacterium]|jgi:branched-chain amino acid transport system ATP-binding protein
MTAVLELADVGRRYGQLRAVDSVTLDVEAGSRHALIGPNGAGKSTLFHLISGTVRATSGRIRFLGLDVTRRGPDRRTRLGMGRTFQHSSLFDDLTARENVALAAQRKLGHAHNPVLPTSRFPDVEARSEELLELVGLGDLADAEAGSLSYGHRRQLEVALALATEPRLLLLDEPTAGMSRDEAARFMNLIGSLPPELTLMIVEHDMDIVFGLATVVSVLDAGHLIASGPPEEIRASAAVQEAYLGPGDRMEQLFTG